MNYLPKSKTQFRSISLYAGRTVSKRINAWQPASSKPQKEICSRAITGYECVKYYRSTGAVNEWQIATKHRSLCKHDPHVPESATRNAVEMRNSRGDIMGTSRPQRTK
jgi:hypothetical protein